MEDGVQAMDSAPNVVVDEMKASDGSGAAAEIKSQQSVKIVISEKSNIYKISRFDRDRSDRSASPEARGIYGRRVSSAF